MSKSCFNYITIICDCEVELNNFIVDELKYKDEESGEDIFYEEINVIKRGKKGIVFEISSMIKPDLQILHSLLKKHPKLWIKNEWNTEHGYAGVWIGCYNSDKMDIVHFHWKDSSIGKNSYFLDEV
jgi:hypothetical protein